MSYFSLLKKSDDAYKMLIEYFSNVDEPTLICMFGDHQPVIEGEFYNYLFGANVDELPQEEWSKKYVTPVIIWTNYDIDEYYLDKISCNFLSALILKEANISMPAYESFLYEVYKEYPVISCKAFYSTTGEEIQPSNDFMEQSEILRKYQWIQYNRMN